MPLNIWINIILTNLRGRTVLVVSFTTETAVCYCLVFLLASCTALHLAEFLADVPHLYESSPSVLKVDGEGVKGFFRMKRYPGSSQNFVNLLEEASREKIIHELEFEVQAHCFSFGSVPSLISWLANYKKTPNI